MRYSCLSTDDESCPSPPYARTDGFHQSYDQFVGRNYVTYINHLYGRSGTLWEGRHKGSVIEDSAHLLACMRYIELNPVRAGITETPGEYRWSSYRDNAFGEINGFVTRHRLFRKLGSTDEARHRAYRELFSNALDPEQIH